MAMVIIAGCCYFRGRHTEVLRSIVAGAIRNVSTLQRIQSGAYPGSSSPDSAQSSSGAHAYPVVAYSTSPPAASCGLPGCETSYSKSATVSLEPTRRASYLPIGFDSASRAIALIDRRPTAPLAIEYLPHDTAVLLFRPVMLLLCAQLLLSGILISAALPVIRLALFILSLIHI